MNRMMAARLTRKVGLSRHRSPRRIRELYFRFTKRDECIQTMLVVSCFPLTEKPSRKSLVTAGYFIRNHSPCFVFLFRWVDLIPSLQFFFFNFLLFRTEPRFFLFALSERVQRVATARGIHRKIPCTGTFVHVACAGLWNRKWKKIAGRCWGREREEE